MSRFRRHVLHRSLQKQRHVLGGELVALPIRHARGRNGILGPARVDARDAEPLAPCRELMPEVTWRQPEPFGKRQFARPSLVAIDYTVATDYIRP